MKLQVVFLLLGSLIAMIDAKKTFHKKYHKKHRLPLPSIVPIKGTAAPPNEVQLNIQKVLGLPTPAPAPLTATIPAW